MDIISSSDTTPHALVVPSSGQGHVVGAMLLAQSLAALGFKISFIYFSSYHATLKERNRLVLPSPELRGDTPSTLSTRCGERCSNGHGSDDGSTNTVPTIVSDALEVADLAPAVECNGSSGGTDGGRGKIFLHVLQDAFEPGDINKHFFVTPAMKENLFNLIVELREQGDPATCLISDSFVPWTLEVTQRAAIPRIELWTSNAMSHLLISNLDVLYSEGILPEKGSSTQWKSETPMMLTHIPGLPPVSSELVPQDLRFADSSNHFVQFFLEVASCVKSGERVLINSLLELEPDAFKSFEVQGIPSYAIGPLPTQTKTEDNVQTECLSWLDLQAESSVIYVAFGSFAKLSVEEMQELAVGLEASGNPFLWVIREDSVTMDELPQVLPKGFLERTKGNGMIISWAPQVKVLAHKAVGGFLSHCGWNSTVESLWAGVPILCCPSFAEQRLNCHYLCNVWGAGLELGRTETGGLDRSLVEGGVKALLHEEGGHKARSKAQEIMHLIEKTSQQGGQSFSNLQKLYDDMRALSSKPSK
ncbi:hypothetical protein GOP47_0026013 [Adiantum capillus-veneris]|uniref:Glycosyltransferase n=1 Tax=Adiantum capillus-veneris TaxID=13818 RepID=A0A9D4Z3E4_ADICA|nr:hypothetical protein GOP47_0026013 [Adiantum capillus-veneris]